MPPPAPARALCAGCLHNCPRTHPSALINIPIIITNIYINNSPSPVPQCGYHTGTIAAAVAVPLVALAMICGILFWKKRKETRRDPHDDLHDHDNTAAFSNPVFIGKDGAGGASQATSVSNPVFTGEPPHASEDTAGGATHTAVHLHDQTQGTVCHRRLTFPIIYIFIH